MKTYKITLEIVLTDDASHPRKWVADAIAENLLFNEGEDLTEINIEEVEQD